MMLSPLLLALTLFAWPAKAQASTPSQERPQSELSYRVRVHPKTGSIDFTAVLGWLDPEEEVLELRMTESYAFLNLGAPPLEGKIRAFDKRNKALVVRANSAFDWSLEKGAEDWVRLEWTVRVDQRAKLGEHSGDNFEHPYLADEHGLLSIPASFVRVPLVPVERTRIHVALPLGWALHSPWSELGGGWYRPAREASMESDYFAVGAWEEQRVEAGGARVSVFFAPGQELLSKAVLPLIEPVLRAELKLFGQQPFERYLVFFGRPDDRGMGGSPKDLSMTVFVAPGNLQGAILDQVAHLIAHEFYHTWIVSQYDISDDLRFLNEGFTDFFAHLIPSQLGLVSSDLFREALCAALVSWHQTPLAGTQSLVEAGGPAFFEGGAAHQLVYQGGLAFAALLDVALMNAEHPTDLAEFLRRFNNDERWSLGGAAPDLGTSRRSWLAT